jgi:hypothetical protein
MLRTFDPKLKLRELQAAEDRKRVSGQQAIKAEISKLVQKDIEMTKTKKVEICASPKIYYVLQKEVQPGDSIFIKGCGFGASKGMVTISPFNKQLEIAYWSNSGIAGKIPDIRGFADPQAITLKVFSYQGQASAPYASLTLKPIIELKIISSPPPTLSDVCPHFSANWGDVLIVQHENHQRGQPCQGMDIVFQGMQLRNNWVFHFIDMKKECEEGEQGIGCNEIGAQVGLVQNMDSLVGRSTIPRIEINWVVGPMRYDDRPSFLYYVFLLYISGPAGTSHQ